jgi:hypothetical protein
MLLNSIEKIEPNIFETGKSTEEMIVLSDFVAKSTSATLNISADMAAELALSSAFH